MGQIEQKVSWAALSVALSAQINALDAMDVEALVNQARDGLPEASELGRAITAFATRYQLVRRMPDDLAEAGKELHRAMLREGRQLPPGLGRADIHG